MKGDLNAWNARYNLEGKQEYEQQQHTSSTLFTFFNGFHKHSPRSQAGVTNGTILAITILTEHSGSTISSPQLTVLELQPRF